MLDEMNSGLRVETLSFGEAADFNPQGWLTWFTGFLER
jgi:hypothetical protein